MRVWVDAWQVQCCGEPFAVGELVRWTLLEQPTEEVLADSGGSPEVVRLTHAEEHHGGLPEQTPPTAGRVRRIRAVTFDHAEVPGQPRVLTRVPGSGVALDCRRADGWESELPAGGGRQFSGYVVDLAPADL